MLGPGNLVLEATGFAAVLAEGDQIEELGAVVDASEIPAALRRRMPSFAKTFVRCGLALLREAPGSDLVLSSQHGDLGSTVELLADLAHDALLSPATFSISVHNAPAGLLGQCLGLSASHTAIAANTSSFPAGLTEAYARLATGEAASVVLVHAEAPMPPIYRPFDDGGPGVHLALRLGLAPSADGAIEAQSGRTGAASIGRALAAGARRIAFTPPRAAARAA
ncbi:MAG: beta-ketoacyl synthase chain length factor [Terricaulis sp.]